MSAKLDDLPYSDILNITDHDLDSCIGPFPTCYTRLSFVLFIPESLNKSSVQVSIQGDGLLCNELQMRVVRRDQCDTADTCATYRECHYQPGGATSDTKSQCHYDCLACSPLKEVMIQIDNYMYQGWTVCDINVA